MQVHRLELYVVRIAATAFAAGLITLTSVIWVTQALREFDLMTAKGQTAIVFFVVTGLSLPLLFLVIAPVALFMSVVYTYNRLATDSELIVMSSAGLSPVRVLRPILFLTVPVAVVVGLVSVYFAPASMRMLREEITRIRADVVANIVQPGKFTSVDKGLTFHMRERDAAGILKGILVIDRRDANQEMIYAAERGQIVETSTGIFLVLDDGSLQRRVNKTQDTSIVFFERYAFDLSQFSGEPEAIHYKPRERTLAELLSPDSTDHYYIMQPARFRMEIHERLVAPLYPLAFVMCAFAFLGQPRSTREGRAAAIAGAVLAVGAVRILGFAASGLATRSMLLVPLVYLIPLAAIAGGYLVGTGRIVLPAPDIAFKPLADLAERIERLVRPQSA